MANEDYEEQRVVETHVPDKYGESAFPVIKPGKYELMLESAEARIAASGNKTIRWTYVIASGEYKGRKLFANTPIEGEYTHFTAEHLHALGWDYEGDVSIDLDELEGRICIGSVTTEVYRGEKRDRLSGVEPYVFESVKPARRSIAERLGAKEPQEEPQTKPARRGERRTRDLGGI